MLYFRWKQAFEAGLLNFWIKHDFLSPLFTITFRYKESESHHALSLEETALPFLVLLFMTSMSSAVLILELLISWLHRRNSYKKMYPRQIRSELGPNYPKISAVRRVLYKKKKQNFTKVRTEPYTPSTSKASKIL